MSNDNIVDVDFEENKYYTLEDVARITNLNEAKISFYCAKLKDFLNIQSIGMYQIFSDVDIDNLNKIKKLEVEENMTIREISEYLKNNKQEVLLKKDNEKIDMSALQIFAHILEVQNEKIDRVIKSNQELIETIKNNTSSNQLLLDNSTAMKKDISKNIEEQINSINLNLDSKMESFVNNIKEELKSAYVTKEEIEQFGRKKSWFSKIFK